MPKKPNYAKFFSVYLGQEVPEKHTDEILLDCPFEDCENPIEHFFGNCDTGEWCCKRCEREGNARTLITMIHEQYLPQTTDKQYRLLERLRGIGRDTFKAASWAYNDERDMWLVPYHTYDPDRGGYTEYLNNLGYFFPSSNNPKAQFTIHKSGALPLYLYNPGIIDDPGELTTSVIDEGEWDTLAHYDLDPTPKDFILGKPGAGFNEKFMRTISHCDTVTFQLDNDTSGQKQLAKCVRIVQEVRPKMKIFVLDYTLVDPFSNCKDPDKPGKDLRDLRIERPNTMLNEIKQARVPYSDSPENDDGPVEKLTAGYVRDATQFPIIKSFQGFIEKWSTKQHLTNKDTRLAMAATFGITTSISISGEPIWSFLIGPPSSGKTTFIESFGGTNQWFDNLSKITAESFVSGWRDETEEEPSYLPSLKNKTLFVKDFTTTLMSPKDIQQKVFGLLTDIFDGHVKIHYGNNQTREFHDTYFNMVAGVTDIVHSHSAASIGERFLRIDWLGKDYDPREYARRALGNFGETNENKKLYTAWSLGFVKHLRSQTIDMAIEPHYFDPLIDLAQFIAIVRTKVESDRYEGMLYKPRTELPTRLAILLGKLYVSCRLVTGSSTLAFDVVRKVAFDTCYGFPLDIVRFINDNPYATKEEIAKGTHIHPQRTYRVLRDLVTTGVLKIEKLKQVKSGKPPQHYDINPKLMPALDPDKYISSYENPKEEDNVPLDAITFKETNGHRYEGSITKDRPSNKRRRPAHPRNRLRTKESRSSE